MPVLSESAARLQGASCSSILSYAYILAAFAFILIGGLLLRRKLRTSPPPPHPTSALPYPSEKAILIAATLPPMPSHQHAHSYPRTLQELPFTPPMLFTEGGETEEKVPSNEYYDSPTEMAFSSFDSFQPETDIPRRRSYTKTSSNGSSVSGEIIQADNWRRHTRVFGSPSGVCLACEESERRMSA